MNSLEKIAYSLGKARQTAKGYSCLCPVHADSNPSLSLSISEEGKILVYCHAGCDFKDILEKLKELELLEGIDLKSESACSTVNNNTVKGAKEIWQSSSSIIGTIAETYLNSRGIKGFDSENLRFAPNLTYVETDINNKKVYHQTPALVAAVLDLDRQLTGVHRIYLSKDGTSKFHLLPNKKSLGTVSGSAVKFGDIKDVLVVTEGIEDALVSYTITGLPTWAVLSASGYKNLILPESIKHIVLVPDNDDAGITGVRDVAMLWTARGLQVSIVDCSPYKDLNEMLLTERGEDKIKQIFANARNYSTPPNPDFNQPTICLEPLGGNGLETFAHTIKSPINTSKTVRSDVNVNDGNNVTSKKSISDISSGSEEPPHPLRRPLNKAQPFPVAALGSILSNAALGIEDAIQSPLEMCIQSVLSTISLVAQPHINLELPIGTAQIRPVSMYFATVGESGERKDSTDNEALKPIYEWEKEQLSVYKFSYEVYQNNKELYEKSKKDIFANKKLSPKDKEAALKDLGEIPEPPIEPIILVGDPTIEGVHKYFEKGCPSLGLMSSEGGQFINGYGMNADNKIKTAASLSGLWDGKPVKRMRSMDGTLSLFQKKLTLHLMFQPGIYEKFLSDKEMLDQGLLSRVLCSYPQSKIGMRLKQSTDPQSIKNIVQFQERVKQLMQIPLPYVQHQEDRLTNTLRPQVIKMTEATKEAFSDFAVEIERLMGSGNLYATIRGFASKLPEHAARLAAIISFFENYSINTKMEYLEPSYFARAKDIVVYYAYEALRLFGAPKVDPNIILAEKLLASLNKWSENYIAKPDVYQNGLAGISNAKQADEILKILVDHKWLIKEKDVKLKGIMRKEVYLIRKNYLEQNNNSRVINNIEQDKQIHMPATQTNFTQMVDNLPVNDLSVNNTNCNNQTMVDNLPVNDLSFPNYHLITDTEEGKQILQALVSSGELVGLDLETTGLYPWQGAEERLLQIATTEKVFVIDLFKISGGLSAFKDWLSQLQAVAHNAVFDMTFLKQAGINLTLDCSMIAHHLATGEQANLAKLCQTYLKVSLDKTLQKSDWQGDLTAEQLQYAALDAFYTLQIFKVIHQKLAEQGSTKIYQVIKQAQMAIVIMKIKGMPFNQDAHTILLGQLQEDFELHKSALKDIMPNINLNSSQQLSEWLTRQLGGVDSINYHKWPKTKSAQLSTSEKDFRSHSNLLSLEAKNIVMDHFLPYKETQKLLSSFGHNFQEALCQNTGRIHANFNLIGTKTGRMSCSRPNLQQIPRDPRFRGLFQAPEGKTLVIADYSQMELRIAALIAKESNLLQAYEQGLDTHAITAAKILNKDINNVTSNTVTKEERQLAKAVNFGLLYGQGAKGLQHYAANSYGVTISEQQADKYRKAWLDAYPKIKIWHSITQTKGQINGYVSTPLGRKRYFNDNDPYSATKAYNTPIQGGAAEVMLIALANLPKNLSNLDAYLISVIHDEVILETTIDNAQTAANILQNTMEQAMQEIFPNATTHNLVNLSIAQSWEEK